MPEIAYLKTTLKGLDELISQHSGNAFLRTQDDSKDRPLRYVFRDKVQYHLAVTPEGLIAGASVFEFVKQIPNSNFKAARDERILHWYNTCVRADFSNQGIGKRLVGMIFDQASRESTLLSVTHFEPDGKSYLARALARSHALYPSLPVLYREAYTPVTAKTPYEIDFEDGFRLQYMQR